MKKLFSQKNILLLAVVLLLIILNYFSILDPIKNSLQFILKPVQSGFSSAANFFGDKISIITTKQNTKDTNQQLREQIIKLWTENSQLKNLKQENQILKLELDYQDKNPETKFITSKIISQSPTQNPSIITLDRGEKDGLTKNLPVIVNNGVLVGRLTQVNKHTSVVTLLSNNNSKVAASFVGLKESNGLVIGQHNLSIQMTLIPADITIEPGAFVVTSGVETNIPAGFLIGQVETVDRLPNDLFQTATLKPIINFSGLKYVLIPINSPLK